jgi:outer membrane protein assembly factor BamB
MTENRSGSFVLSGLGIVLALIGCGPSASDEFPAPVVRDSAGIRIVEHGGIPQNLQSWSISSDPIIEIGSVEGAGPDVFGRIESVAVLSAGTIVVADGLSSELRAFDQQGRHLWTAGRRGGGPGEFTSLDGAYVAEGDSIVVAGGGRVMSIFGSNGAYARQFQLDSPPGEYPAGPIISGVTSEGTVIGSALAMPSFEPGYYRTALMVTCGRHHTAPISRPSAARR